MPILTCDCEAAAIDEALGKQVLEHSRHAAHLHQEHVAASGSAVGGSGVPYFPFPYEKDYNSDFVDKQFGDLGIHAI